jgi:hypothetical protein
MCMRAFFFFGGAPHTLTPDNLKSAVTKANRYEPEFNALLEQLCLHYNTALMPARVVKPKDKPSVEKSVALAYQRIYAPLRHRTFDSLQELNKAILEQLAIHHNRKFRKSDHTRKEIFITQEQGALRPLPADFMLIKQSVSAKVQKKLSRGTWPGLALLQCTSSVCGSADYYYLYQQACGSILR